MKRLLLAAVGIFALSACGAGNSTPGNPSPGTNNSSVTGTWDGTLTGPKGALTTYAEVTQTNTPNSGDVTGKMTFPQIDPNQLIALTGNVATGYINLIDLSGSIKCQGTFLGSARYEASCLYSANGTTFDAQLVMKKR